jgi:hypothetical protein
LGIAGRFLSGATGTSGRTNSAQRKAKNEERVAAGRCSLKAGKEKIMDYLIVFATMLMIAGYACIVGRALHDVK